MKGYVGRRDFDGVKVYVITSTENKGLQREPLKHVMIHSPDGFEWGYNGSGPADLALSILADFFGENPTPGELRQGRHTITVEDWAGANTEPEVAELMEQKRLKCSRYHQPFKEAFVAKFAKESWTLEEGTVRRWVEEQGAG
jgi:hypothetical protein